MHIDVPFLNFYFFYTFVKMGVYYDISTYYIHFMNKKAAGYSAALCFYLLFLI